ncbi:hypothetical protein [Enterobacter phage 01_vB_Eclo_IJM]|nr:hypothetical protein [Enterobacter phage 01_vB_Eclo_IJM]
MASTYPTEPDFSDGTRNYSPCLALVNKEGIRISNGTYNCGYAWAGRIALVNCRNVTVSVRVLGRTVPCYRCAYWLCREG